MKLDRHNNPYLLKAYLDFSQEEKLTHFNSVGKAIEKHKELYYSKTPVINDAEYDYIERYYEAVADDLGVEPIAVNSVGFKIN